MSVRRDTRTGRWFFRARVNFPDGRRDRIFGTPGVPGLYHELPNTRAGAIEAEHRAIVRAMTGELIHSAKEVETIRQYVTKFMDGYAASHKPSSRRDKQQRLDADILPYVGDLRLNEVRQEHVDAIVAALLKREKSRKGINTSLSVLSSLMKYAATNKLIDDVDLRFTIKAQAAELECVSPADVVALVDATKDARYRAGILLAADAGLRIGEIRALPWIEVNELARELTVAWSYDRSGALTETKGWERRTLPITDRLWAALRALDRKGPLVFARLDGKPIGYDGVRDEMHAIYEAAGVDPPAQPWHALRHTFITELANCGTAVHVIRKLAGHKSLETTLRYMHVDRDQKRAAIAALVPLGSQRAAASKTAPK